MMKDHQIAQLVNQLRDAAITYHASGQLRERISALVNDALKPQPIATTGALPSCNQEVFETGVSVGIYDIPRAAAESICTGVSRATGARVDWHYIGGRVHIKALPAPQRGASTLTTLLMLLAFGLLFVGLGGR